LHLHPPKSPTKATAKTQKSENAKKQFEIALERGQPWDCFAFLPFRVFAILIKSDLAPFNSRLAETARTRLDWRRRNNGLPALPVDQDCPWTE
jgi:hypothetical protein